MIAQKAEVSVYVAPDRYNAGLLAEADAEMARPPIAPEPQGQTPGLVTAASTPTSAASPAPTPPSDSSAETEDVPAAPEFRPIHLLDDGFQHRQLFRNADILLVNRHDWHDLLLPAGNLRESHEAAHRATVIAIPAEEPEFEEELRKWGWEGPIWRLHRRVEVPFVEGPVLAFCGIARPEQFFKALEAKDLHMVAQLAFPDHFRYPSAILEQNLAEARKAGAKALITTEKDLARLGKLASIFPDSIPLLTARLSIEIEDVEAAMDWLLDGLV
jgi:tetraacyldisaccharide 4'-kinase